MLAHDDNIISRFEGNPPGTVHRAVAGIGAQHSEEPCAACATGDVHTGVPSNRGIPEGAGQPIGTVPVNPEPSHASHVGRNYLHLSRYIKFPYNAVEQANIKAQFEARASFPNVIGAIDCTHSAIKAPSR